MKFFLALAIVGLTFLASSSCTKEIIKEVNITDTLVVRDTTIIKDTTIIRDTTIVRDSIYIRDSCLQSGLMVYYPFSGTFSDSSGNGFHLTNVNSVGFVADTANAVNKAVIFNGVNQRLFVNDNGLLYSGKKTVSFLFSAANSSENQAFFSHTNYEDATGLDMNGGLETDGRPGYAVGGPTMGCTILPTTSNSASVLAPTAITKNVWHSFIAVYAEGTMNLYIDGNLVATRSTSFSLPNFCEAVQLTLGSWWSGDPNFYMGKLDEFRMYNRAITKQEIAYLSKL